MPSTEIVVRLKEVYGKTLIYPANEAAAALADLSRQTTINPRDLVLARDKLGIPFRVCNANHHELLQQLTKGA